MQLSFEDQKCLQTHELSLQLIWDRLVGVVEGLFGGLYLFGEGGTGKSHIVSKCLAKMLCRYILLNSRLSGRALVDVIAEHSDAIIVIEDAETLFKDRNALGVLRSALWAQDRSPRVVTWTVHKEQLRCEFSGGLIVIGNTPLADIPELQALATRIPVMQLAPTQAQLSALMRSTALEGFQQGDLYLEPDQCWIVVEHVILRCRELGRNLDLRLLRNAFLDCLQWRHEQAETHWHDLVESRLKQVVAVKEAPTTRQQRLQQESAILAELLALHLPQKDRAALWQERTGKSDRAFYRRLKEIKSSMREAGTDVSENGGEQSAITLTPTR